jgi:hypothetical protein
VRFSAHGAYYARELQRRKFQVRRDNEGRPIAAPSLLRHRERARRFLGEGEDGSGEGEGSVQRARKCHGRLTLSRLATWPGSRDFDCNREQRRCARSGPRPGRAVPLNPTGITCAGHNMSGSIKIRTAQIKLSLRPMSDRGYLAGCELPHVLPGPRCDSRMRRTHPHN